MDLSDGGLSEIVCSIHIRFRLSFVEVEALPANAHNLFSIFPLKALGYFQAIVLMLN